MCTLYTVQRQKSEYTHKTTTSDIIKIYVHRPTALIEIARAYMRIQQTIPTGAVVAAVVVIVSVVPFGLILLLKHVNTLFTPSVSSFAYHCILLYNNTFGRMWFAFDLLYNAKKGQYTNSEFEYLFQDFGKPIAFLLDFAWPNLLLLVILSTCQFFFSRTLDYRMLPKYRLEMLQKRVQEKVTLSWKKNLKKNYRKKVLHCTKWSKWSFY